MKVKFVRSWNLVSDTAIVIVVTTCSGICGGLIIERYPIFRFEYKQDCDRLKINLDEVRVYPMFDGRLIIALPVTTGPLQKIKRECFIKLIEDLKRKISIFSEEVIVLDDFDWLHSEDKNILRSVLKN